ncbi:unnamed protein product, partial [Iphiclides podalirius]
MGFLTLYRSGGLRGLLARGAGGSLVPSLNATKNRLFSRAMVNDGRSRDTELGDERKRKLEQTPSVQAISGGGVNRSADAFRCRHMRRRGTPIEA